MLSSRPLCGTQHHDRVKITHASCGTVVCSFLKLGVVSTSQWSAFIHLTEKCVYQSVWYIHSSSLIRIAQLDYKSSLFKPPLRKSIDQFVARSAKKPKKVAGLISRPCSERSQCAVFCGVYTHPCDSGTIEAVEQILGISSSFFCLGKGGMFMVEFGACRFFDCDLKSMRRIRYPSRSLAYHSN